MATYQIVLLSILSVASLLTCSKGFKLSRESFPSGFVFGAASSAYQYEGAAGIEYGKKPSIWDTFTKEHPEKIPGGSSGELGVDFYHRYKGDISLMKEIGFDSFRFSISWPRILPSGTISGGVNLKGVIFYDNLIDELLKKGLKPMVTLFHWDLPQALEDEYGGLLSPEFVKDYHDYAKLCFTLFGDRVKHWTTFNEPYIFTTGGYEGGFMAPGRCSNYVGNCTHGNSGIEPYTVVHHILLAHADVVNLYRMEFQESQKGIIGIVETCQWMEPKFKTSESRKAAKRAMDFMIGWVYHPVVFGDYPKTMRDLVGSRLPKFTRAQSKLLNQSFDFLGINYYSARYADDSSDSINIYPSPTNDSRVDVTILDKDGNPIGPSTPTAWLKVYPKGIENLVMHVKENYNNPPIYITENGVVDIPYVEKDILNSNTLNLSDYHLDDGLRIKFLQDHLTHLLNAIRAGADVRGYYVWTLFDCFEWFSGFYSPFGIVHIDRQNNFRRTRKRSAYWFRSFLQNYKALDQQPSLLASA